ncbi:MAG: hypothetical protein R3E84_16200 [Pseudomonadales bacterium]
MRSKAICVKAEPPLVARVTPGDRDALESRLYGRVQGRDGFCHEMVVASAGASRRARGRQSRAHPEHGHAYRFFADAVRLLGVLQGNYVAGLVSGWIMTWLDTVDGKLAK